MNVALLATTVFALTAMFSQAQATSPKEALTGVEKVTPICSVSGLKDVAKANSLSKRICEDVVELLVSKGYKNVSLGLPNPSFRDHDHLIVGITANISKLDSGASVIVISGQISKGGKLSTWGPTSAFAATIDPKLASFTPSVSRALKKTIDAMM